jgi:hypothetical protein
MPSLAWERYIGLSLWERSVNRWMRDAKMHHLYFKHFFSLSHFPLSLSLLTSSTILFPCSFSTPLFFLQLQIKTFIFFLNCNQNFHLLNTNKIQHIILRSKSQILHKHYFFLKKNLQSFIRGDWIIIGCQTVKQ